MKIKSIHIKNVRGLKDHCIELNMIPNKPSILVAPNGSGKSSFAFAFQWLNRQRMKLDEDNAYEGDVTNKPKLIIETSEPNGIFKADKNKNEISRKFGIYVINNSIKAVSPGRTKGILMGKSYLAVPEIVMIDKISKDIDLTDDFEENYDLETAPQGTYPKINDLLKSNRFMVNLECDSLKCNKAQLTVIADFIERSKKYEGSKVARRARIEKDDYGKMKDIPDITYAMSVIKSQCRDDDKISLLIKAVKFVTLYYRKEKDVKRRIEYYKYKIEEQNCKELFNTLRNTWRGIKPHREQDKVILKIGDAQRISNGERDTLTFLANLYKAKSQLTKEYNVLIIDEVFDYLDDANLMAAQYYVTKFIKELRNEGQHIFPVILSHLNPDYYRQCAFKDMKVYYLSPLPHPHASDDMMKLLRERKKLADAAGGGNEENISKYMLHFNNDYSKDMSDVIGDCPKKWGDIKIFKQDCANQLADYLDSKKYDPLSVCVALRELIEQKVYESLHSMDEKENFIKEHGTANKLCYAETCGINVSEIYYLLGNIYNDPMHVNDKSNKLITQTLYSRLENNTIREMIKSVKEGRV